MRVENWNPVGLSTATTLLVEPVSVTAVALYFCLENGDQRSRIH